jgi:phosphoserine phosphatase
MATLPSILVTLSGRDYPGISESLFAALAPLDLTVADIEQIQVHGRLLLCVELAGSNGVCPPVESVGELVERGFSAAHPDVAVTVTELDAPDARRSGARQFDPASLARVFGQIAACGANVDRIVRLSHYPVASYELAVSGGDAAVLRRELGLVAADLGVDVAVQRAGLHRRAKHLIVLDADSTLLQGEVIDMLAAKVGCEDEVAAITAAAMAGELDFAAALRQRVALLEGLDEGVLTDLGRQLLLAPGARTLVRTLKRLGYVTAVVSGGFVQVITELMADLGIDHVAANQLEVRAGKVTGRLAGPVVDRAGKADALRQIAEQSGVPLTQTVAVGDGANDIDMLATAGLGIAYNARPIVRDAADTALSVPYLDAILFLLGISREEIEAADSEYPV